MAGKKDSVKFKCKETSESKKKEPWAYYSEEHGEL